MAKHAGTAAPDSTDLRAGIDYPGVGVGVIIQRHDPDGTRYLMMHRGPEARNEPNHWDFPGGGHEGGRLEDTVSREIIEELGTFLTNIASLGYLQHQTHATPNQPSEDWISFTFLAELAPDSPEPRICEPHKCTELSWFTLAEIEQLPLLATSMPANLELLRKHEASLSLAHPATNVPKELA